MAYRREWDRSTHQIGAGAVEYSSCTTANWSFQSKAVSIQVISIRTQGVKLHKKSGDLITSIVCA